MCFSLVLELPHSNEEYADGMVKPEVTEVQFCLANQADPAAKASDSLGYVVDGPLTMQGSVSPSPSTVHSSQVPSFFQLGIAV